MEVVLDWENMNASSFEENVLDIPVLGRASSEALASFAGSDDDTDLDAALLEALDDNYGNAPHSPISYASSDDSASTTDMHSGASHSSDDVEVKKKRNSKKRTTMGLSAQEKREQRKLRNRELAAESRKRKNDEMERLRGENLMLKAKVAELERQLAITNGITKTVVNNTNNNKRTRVGTIASTSVAVASLVAFVVAGPAESHPGLSSSTASVLITALDSCEGRFGISPSSIGRFLFTLALATMVLFVLASVVFQYLKASVNSFPFKLASTVERFSLPRRVNSLTISNSV